MPNVENVNRFLFSKHDKQETVRAAIARAEEQFANGLVERRALGSHGTPLEVVSETPCGPA